jgi:hypothetical protein
MDVEHGGVDLGMTHELLEGGQGDTVAHHIGSEGMAKPMRIGLRDLGGQAVVTEQGAQSG